VILDGEDYGGSVAANRARDLDWSLHVCAKDNFMAQAGSFRGVCGWARGRSEPYSRGPASESSGVGALTFYAQNHCF